MSDNTVVAAPGTVTLYWQGLSSAVVGSIQISLAFAAWMCLHRFACRTTEKYVHRSDGSGILISDGYVLRCGVSLELAYLMWLKEIVPARHAQEEPRPAQSA